MSGKELKKSEPWFSNVELELLECYVFFCPRPLTETEGDQLFVLELYSKSVSDCGKLHHVGWAKKWEDISTTCIRARPLSWDRRSIEYESEPTAIQISLSTTSKETERRKVMASRNLHPTVFTPARMNSLTSPIKAVSGCKVSFYDNFMNDNVARFKTRYSTNPPSLLVLWL